MSITEMQFLDYVGRNETNRFLLGVLPELRLPHGMLSAGCLFQTVWNVKTGNPPDWSIRDYDVIYFDGGDLSWEAEDAFIQAARRRLGALADKVEIRNQARVHLWYGRRFGTDCPPLTRVEDGIDRHLVRCTRLGIALDDGAVYAPDGFDDMWNGILRPNPFDPRLDLFRAKCRDYRARWPWLSVAE